MTGTPESFTPIGFVPANKIGFVPANKIGFAL